MIKVVASGRLTKDANVFSYGQGKSGVNFTLACNQIGRDEAVFINCVVFGRDENLAQYLKMGNQIIVNGNLTIDKNNDNYYTKIIVDELEFGAKKQNNNDSYANFSNNNYDDTPF